MSESEQDIESMTDSDGDTFGIYVSANISSERALEIIRNDDSEDDDDDRYKVTPAQGQTTQQICQLHRERATKDAKLHKSLFLVVDSDAPETRGVLLVNLEPEHGYPDAVRKEQDEAADAIASLSIMNTDWYTERESDEEKSARLPEDSFALYNLMGPDHSEDFELAIKTMNDGVQEVNAEEPEDGDGYAVPGPPFGVSKKYHRGIRVDHQDLAEVVQTHASYAEAHDLDPSYFAVFDDKFMQEGALFVRPKPDLDSFRCKHPVAGEILGWMFINFMTWEEAKEFAARQ